MVGMSESKTLSAVFSYITASSYVTAILLSIPRLILRVLSTLTLLCWGGVRWSNPGWPLGDLTRHSAYGSILTASWTPLLSLCCKNLGEKIGYHYQIYQFQAPP